jgi:hypothetical protein
VLITLPRPPAGPLAAEASEAAPLSRLARQTGEARLHAVNRDWPAAHKVLTHAHPGALPRSLSAARSLLAEDAESLLCLGAVRDALHGPLPQDSAALERHLLRLARVVEDGLLAQVRQSLLVRAHLEGRSDLLRILPQAPENPTAQTLLRDLKALNAQAPSAALSESRIASVLGPLPVPEAPAAGFRPGVKEALDADLPTLKRLAATEKEVRLQVVGNIEKAARARADHFHLHQYHLAHTLRALPRSREEKKNRTPAPSFAVLEAGLGRLTPGERLLVQHLSAKKTPEQTLAILRRLREKGANP